MPAHVLSHYLNKICLLQRSSVLQCTSATTFFMVFSVTSYKKKFMSHSVFNSCNLRLALWFFTFPCELFLYLYVETVSGANLSAHEQSV